MNFFLLTWNPLKWSPSLDELQRIHERTASGKVISDKWSTGRRNSGVGVGDRVFLLRQGIDQGIVAFGLVTAEISPAAHFDGSGRIANYVGVEWHQWVHHSDRIPIRVLESIAPNTSWRNVMGSGIKLNANDAQAIEKLLAKSRGSGPRDQDSELRDDEHESRLQQRTDFEGPLEKSQVITARRGQGLFRENVLALERSCRVTGTPEVHHLVASHIKPWRESDDVEKIDGNNGLLLAPHVDHLFDRGWITFSSSGKMICSKGLSSEVLQSWGLSPGQDVGKFSPEQEKYLEYHRRCVFRDGDDHEGD